MCDVANSLTAETLTVRSTLPEENTSGAETPDLSRFYKSRSRDTSLIETAKKICADLQLPLFTVVTLLKREGITEKEMASRMPDHTDPLFVAYRETVARKQKNPQRRSPRLHY